MGVPARSQPLFDTSADADLRVIARRIRQAHAQVESVCYQGVLEALVAGDYLHLLKRAAPHGSWSKLRGQLLPNLSERTCQRYMDLSRILRSVPGLILGPPGEPWSKATRASVLTVLRDSGLTSIRKVLASVKSDTKAIEVSREEAVPIALPREFDTNEEEWISPPELVHGAIELFGAIDLDPCGATDPRWQLTSCATLTKADDALRTDLAWWGRMFIHPPRSQTQAFVERAVNAVMDGGAEEALIVLPALTDATYMDVLRPFSRAFLRQRPTFMTPCGEFVRPPVPYMLVFITRSFNRADAFADAYLPIADVYNPQHL